MKLKLKNLLILIINILIIAGFTYAFTYLIILLDNAIK